MKNTSLILASLIITLGFVVSSLASDGVRSPIKWKYGYGDGFKANTIGSPRYQDIPPSLTASPGSGYTPAQIAGAYGFNLTNSAGNGSGSVLAVVVAYGSASMQSDLNVFCSQYGLPTTTLSIVYPSGQPRAKDSGWASETMLDVEWSHAMAPGAKIVVVVSPDDSLSNLLAAVNYAVTSSKADVVSMSWGTQEFFGELASDSYFNHPGTSFVAAAGDSASVVDWPAASPYVLAVGGTSLQINSLTGSISSETAWGSGGGGVSRYEQLPAFQAGFNVNSGRGIPDVSYVADPYTGVNVYLTDPITQTGGWAVYGGTSVGTPQWAALLARRKSLGNAGGTMFQSNLYAECKSGLSPWLRDITSGSNGHPATTGYDLSTGLGSPNAAQLATIPSAVVIPSPMPNPTPSSSATPLQTPVSRNPGVPTPSPTPISSPTPPQSSQSWGSWWPFGHFHWGF
jgi:subtilase family serine protease